MVLICVTLITNEVENPSLCLWTILTSFVRGLFKFHVHCSYELSVLFIFWI